MNVLIYEIVYFQYRLTYYHKYLHILENVFTENVKFFLNAAQHYDLLEWADPPDQVLWL